MDMGADDARCFADTDIAALGRLADDTDQEVRGDAALMISAVGVRARSTIPALRAAASKEHCGTSGSHPAGLLMAALIDLGGAKPGERLCGTAKQLRW